MKKLLTTTAAAALLMGTAMGANAQTAFPDQYNVDQSTVVENNGTVGVSVDQGSNFGMNFATQDAFAGGANSSTGQKNVNGAEQVNKIQGKRVTNYGDVSGDANQGNANVKPTQELTVIGANASGTQTNRNGDEQTNKTSSLNVKNFGSVDAEASQMNGNHNGASVRPSSEVTGIGSNAGTTQVNRDDIGADQLNKVNRASSVNKGTVTVNADQTNEWTEKKASQTAVGIGSNLGVEQKNRAGAPQNNVFVDSKSKNFGNVTVDATQDNSPADAESHGKVEQTVGATGAALNADQANRFSGRQFNTVKGVKAVNSADVDVTATQTNNDGVDMDRATQTGQAFGSSVGTEQLNRNGHIQENVAKFSKSENTGSVDLSATQKGMNPGRGNRDGGTFQTVTGIGSTFSATMKNAGSPAMDQLNKTRGLTSTNSGPVTVRAEQKHHKNIGRADQSVTAIGANMNVGQTNTNAGSYGAQ